MFDLVRCAVGMTDPSPYVDSRVGVQTRGPRPLINTLVSFSIPNCKSARPHSAGQRPEGSIGPFVYVVPSVSQTDPKFDDDLTVGPR